MFLKLPPASFRSRNFFHLVKLFLAAQHLPFFFLLFPPSLPFLLHVRRRSKVVHFSLGVVDFQSTSEHRRQTERTEHGETEERDAETDKLQSSFSPPRWGRRHFLLFTPPPPPRKQQPSPCLFLTHRSSSSSSFSQRSSLVKKKHRECAYSLLHECPIILFLFCK